MPNYDKTTIKLLLKLANLIELKKIINDFIFSLSSHLILI